MRTSALRRGIATLGVAAVASAGVVAVMSPSYAETTTLISTADTTWSYLDDGTDPADGLPDRTDWADPGFDDSGWKSAQGPFGAKGGQLASVSGYLPTTLLDQYREGTTNHEAFFFRTEVTIPEGGLEGVTSVPGSVRYDDAATVYVNGERVAGFDDSEITANLQYGGSNADVPKLGEFTVPVEELTEGENTIAVELHQGRASSSDIYFDFVGLELDDAETTAPSPISDQILNIGADETQRNVNWFSTAGGDEVVELVPASSLVDGAFPATGATVFAATGSPASEAGKTAYKATITGLKPTTEYAYRVGSAEGGWSEPATFTTGDFDDSYDFLYVGDPQIGSSGNVPSDTDGWSDTMEKARIEVPTAEWLLSAGDQVNSAPNETEYDGFLSPHAVRELATATTVGNHEAGSKSTYYSHYNVPNYDAESGDYWYTYGNTLYLNIDSNNRGEAGNQKHVEWMEKTLADNPDTEWQVVVMHHAMYSSGPHATDSDVLERRAFFSEEFQRLGIDLALAGHDHIYTRSHPMDGTTPVPAPEPAEGKATEIPAHQGTILYMTASSASGSKFYSGESGDADWVAVSNDQRVPQFTKVSVSSREIRLRTYRTSDMALVDEVALVDESEPEPGPDPEPTPEPTPTPQPTPTPPVTQPKPPATDPGCLAAGRTADRLERQVRRLQRKVTTTRAKVTRLSKRVKRLQRADARPARVKKVKRQVKRTRTVLRAARADLRWSRNQLGWATKVESLSCR